MEEYIFLLLKTKITYFIQIADSYTPVILEESYRLPAD